jgi:pimeloyl-ACP methyl ester carboxylesterase
MGGLAGCPLAGDHPERVGRLILEEVAVLRPASGASPNDPPRPRAQALLAVIKRFLLLSSAGSAAEHVSYASDIVY